MMRARIFANPEVVIEGWYWLLRTRDLRRGRAVAVTLIGRDLVVYRGQDGRVAALDAYCRHMGAHLAEGRVEGDAIRCFFHRWKWDSRGRCVEVPSQGSRPLPVRTRAWPVAERYGLIWLWTGEAPGHPVPEVPELEGVEVDSALGSSFRKACHPHVVLVNAIDEHHFNSVHRLPVRLHMAAREVDRGSIHFSNTEAAPATTVVGRLLRRVYRGPLTYAMSYHSGSTGTVTLGPDRLHFHIMFALRPTPDGRTEGQTVVLTRRRRGPLAFLFNRVVLLLTRVVGRYFARGDSRVFRTIRFDLRTPTAADHAIVAFLRHTERQPVAAWGPSDSAPGRPAPGLAREAAFAPGGHGR